MLDRYPKVAGRLEAGAQLSILLSLLAFAGFYSMIMASAPEPDVAERMAIVMRAMKITGLAFLLALCGTALRHTMTEPPLVLIWGGLLATATVVWGLAWLILLSAL